MRDFRLIFDRLQIREKIIVLEEMLGLLESTVERLGGNWNSLTKEEKISKTKYAIELVELRNSYHSALQELKNNPNAPLDSLWEKQEEFRGADA